MTITTTKVILDMERKENAQCAIDCNKTEQDRAVVLMIRSLENEDGTINRKKLKELLLSYAELQMNAEKVYTTVTKGILKQSHYPADTVLSIYSSLQNGLIDKSVVYEDMMSIISDEATKDAIREYFGKTGE